MRKINKDIEPIQLTSWRLSNPSKHYEDLGYDHLNIRKYIRKACLVEQYRVCAYCGEQISNKSCHNEHIKPQSTFQNLSLDFKNIVASCDNKKQCGDAKENHEIHLTPLMDECETELIFNVNGCVEGTTARGAILIDTIKLGKNRAQNRLLVEKRKQAIDSIIFTINEDNELETTDTETLKKMCTALKKPIEGKLQSYSSALINTLQQLIKANE